MTAAASRATPKRQRLAYDDRHEQLVGCAEELFIENGYAAVSMEDIARAAGITRPVVYTHFATKEGVYIACVRRARREFEAELAEAIDLTAPPREQLRVGADATFAMLERNPGRWRLLFGSNAMLPGVYSEELARLRSTTVDAIAVLLGATAVKASEERRYALAYAISGIGERLGHWWLANPEMTREEVVEHMTAIVWSGIREYVADDQG